MERPKLRAIYWRHNRDVMNFGDYLTEVLLNDLGYDFAAPGTPNNKIANPGEILMAVGSLIDHDWLGRKVKWPRVVWGCGAWGDGRLVQGHIDRIKRITLVRGPNTAKRLNFDGPQGDPSLLLPLFHPIEQRHNTVVYVPHWHNIRSAKKLADTLGVEWSSIGCRKEDWETKLHEIVEPEFVLTNAMHAAIVRTAYGRPWAFYLGGCKWDKPGKWYDWFAWLGTPLCRVESVEEGLQWWDDHLSSFSFNSHAILGSFPYPLLSERAKQLNS